MSSTLKASRRQKLGSRQAQALRSQGSIPASIQGAGDSPHLDIAIGEVEFLTSRRKHEHLYDIDVDGKVETAVVRELQWDPFGQRIQHVEFVRVRRGVAIESEVELVFEGRPKSGQLIHIVTHVTLRSLPAQIPDSIEVQVDELSSGATILAKDLLMPEGVSLAIPADTKIAVVREAREVIEAPAEAAPTGDSGLAPPSAPA